MTPTQPAGEPTTMRHDGETRAMTTTGRTEMQAVDARGGVAIGWAAGWVQELSVWLGTLALLVGWAAPAAAQGPAGTIEYYGTDEVGSVRIIFSPTGTVVGRADYQPFGEEFNIDPAFARIRFGGQETDVEAGFQYFNARLLQTRTGRFEKPDPIFSGGAVSNPQLWNRYAYALNSPLAVVDPSGLCTDPPVTDASSGICGDVQLNPFPPPPRAPGGGDFGASGPVIEFPYCTDPSQWGNGSCLPPVPTQDPDRVDPDQDPICPGDPRCTSPPKTCPPDCPKTPFPGTPEPGLEDTTVDLVLLAGGLVPNAFRGVGSFLFRAGGNHFRNALNPAARGGWLNRWDTLRIGEGWHQALEGFSFRIAVGRPTVVHLDLWPPRVAHWNPWRLKAQ
jgi:RHS repeat-associated protein